MRIEVLFDKQAKVSQVMMNALAMEIEKKILPKFPKANLRIALSSSTSIQISGSRNEGDYANVQQILQDIWEDDSWLPN